MPPWRRILLWVGGLAAYLVATFVLGTFLVSLLLMAPPWDPGGRGWIRVGAGALQEDDWWDFAVPVAAGIAVSQFLFLVPVLWLRPPRGERPRPLAVSFVIGGLVAALLTVGLLAGLAELAAGLLHGDLAVSPWGGTGRDLLDQEWVWAAAAIMFAGSWLLWTGVLFVFTRRLWADTVVGRLAMLLLGGTVVELLVVVPIDAMVRRRTSCTCATGSFWALCFSAVGHLWLTGPGVLLVLTSRRRRLARATHCSSCGNAKGPSPGRKCPECGYAWMDQGDLRTTAGGAADYTEPRQSGTDGDRSSAG